MNDISQKNDFLAKMAISDWIYRFLAYKDLLEGNEEQINV